MRSITCANSNGSSITFGEREFTPFLLAHVDGLYDSANEVSILENAVIDGGDYQGSRSTFRNVVITVCARPGTKYAQPLRDVLRSVFGKGAKGTLTYTENGSQRITEYYTESIMKGDNQLYMISLICPDPWLYDPEYTTIQLSRHQSLFTFPHVFKSAGEELSRDHTDDVIAHIEGTSDEPLGMIFRINAKGPVRNPSITNVYRQDKIQLGWSNAEADPPISLNLDLRSGDIVEVVTEKGKRRITLTRDGQTTSINQYLTDDSTFLTLHKGENVFGYGAESGADNVALDICYRNRYEGA